MRTSAKSSSRSSHFAFSLLLAALCALAPRAAVAQPAERLITSLDYGARLQMPSVRLRAMGGIELGVRDEYTELNLWDFAGIGSGLWSDRDSTHLDFWYETEGATLDRLEGGTAREFSRPRASTLGLEAAARSSSFVIGVNAGRIATEQSVPFGDGAHTSLRLSTPVAVVNAAGRFLGSTFWGLRGTLGRSDPQRRWWHTSTSGDPISIAPEGERIGEPNLFTPTDGHTNILGFGASLSGEHRRYGSAGVHVDYRRDKVVLSQRGGRHVFEETEPRQALGYGVAAVLLPVTGVQVAAHAGRETFDADQEYRFSLSGGSTDPAFSQRGDMLERDGRVDFLRLRALADLRQVPVTVGGSMRVAYHREHVSPETGPNAFNTFVLDELTTEVLEAPSLVEEDLGEVRTLEFGGGASAHLLERQALVGAEFRTGRDAINGTDRFRKAKRWEVRAGGEYRFTTRWTGRLGWQHRRLDQDDLQELDEYVVDRVSVGVGSRLRSWRVDLGGHLEWWRTDFPDPAEAGGNGTGFSLSLGREF